MSNHRRQQGTQQCLPEVEADGPGPRSSSQGNGGPGNAALAERTGSEAVCSEGGQGPSDEWGGSFWELETSELGPVDGPGAGAEEAAVATVGGDEREHGGDGTGDGEESQLDGNVGGGGGGGGAVPGGEGAAGGGGAPAVEEEGGGDAAPPAEGPVSEAAPAPADGGGEGSGGGEAPADGGGGGGMSAPALESDGGGGGGAADLGVCIDDTAFNVSGPDSPIIDDLVMQSTGMSLDDHLAEDQLCIDELDALGRDLQSGIGQQTLGVDIPAIDSLAATQAQSIEVSGADAVCSLDEQAAATSDQIASSTDLAVSSLASQADAASASLLTAEETAAGDLQSRYQQFVADAEALQTGWEGRFRARVTAGKQEIEAYATTLSDAQKALGEEAAAGAAGSGSALAQAKAVAGAEAEKTKREAYADSIVAYSRTAVAHLEANADQDTVLGGQLLAPTIEQARPEMEAHEVELRAAARERERELYHAQREAQACLETSSEAEQSHLETQQTEASTFLDQTSQGLTEQVEGARMSMESNSSEAADAIHSAATEGHSELNTAVGEVDGIIDSRALRTFTDEQTSAIESDRSAALQSLESDRTAQVSQLDDEAQECVDETATAAQDQATRISEGGNVVSEQIVSGATDAGTDLVDAAAQTTEGMATAGDALSEGLSSSTDQVHTESEAQLARYDLMVQSYVNHAKAELDRLVGYADTAATSARTSAEAAKGQDIAQRSDKAFQAIDGMGTDESSLRAAIFGVTAIEGRALEEDYETNADDYDSSEYSSYLRYDIDDDTSGSLQRGLILALNGDKAGAALELMQARTDWGNTDSESILAELRQLNEEERTQLMNHPEFPEIRSQVAAHMTLETGQLIGGANQWELDQFMALTDVERSREEAHARADAIQLMQAYEGSILNPTDEATAYTVMGQYKESMGLLEQEFASYATERRLTIDDEEGLGQLTMHARDEMSVEELDRAEALIAGDTAAARAAAFQYSARRGEEQDAFDTLENADMDAYREGENGQPASGDFLAQLDARSEQTEMQSDWTEQYGGTQVYVNNGYDEYGHVDYEMREVNTMGEMIDARFEHQGSGNTDRREDDIMHQLLDNGQADAELWMAYGIAGAGTREKYVTKALEQLKNSRTRPEDLQQMRDFLRENYGIDDLEAEMGFGEHRGDWGTELSGQEAFEADAIFQEVTATDNDIDQMYDRAMMVWEHYRDPATYAGVDLEELQSLHDSGDLTPMQEDLLERYQIRRDEFDGNDGLLDGFTRSDEVLDSVMADLNELYATRDTWTEMREVGGRQSRQPISAQHPSFVQFKTLSDRVTRAGTVYNNQRQAILDNITMAVQIIGAVLITAVTAGGGLTVVGGLLASMALGAMSMAFQAAVLGPGYGYERFLADLGKVVADAIVQVGTAGLGSRFRGLQKVLEEDLFKAYPAIMRAALSESIAGLPGETVNALFDERMWDSDNPEEALVGALAIGTVKNLARGVGSGGMESLQQGLGVQVSAQTNRYLQGISSNVMGVLGDYNIMSGDDVGFELLKAVGTGTMTAALTNATVTHVAQRINTEGATDTNQAHLYGVSEDARNAVMAHLDPSVLAALPDSLLVGGNHQAFADDRLATQVRALQEAGGLSADEVARILAIENFDARRAAYEDAQTAAAQQSRDTGTDVTADGTPDPEGIDPTPVDGPELDSAESDAPVVVDGPETDVEVIPDGPETEAPVVTDGAETEEDLADRTLRELDERHGDTDDPVVLDETAVETTVVPVADGGVTDDAPAPVSTAASDPVIHAINTLPDSVLRQRLEGIPDIGPATASAILQARAQGGPFETLGDLMARVSGVGPVRGAHIHTGLETGLSGPSVDAATTTTRPLTRATDGWSGPDGTPATETELNSLRAELADRGGRELRFEMDRVAYTHYVVHADQPLEPAAWQAQRRQLEDRALSAMSARLHADPDLLAAARASLPAVGEGSPEDLRRALDFFKADGQFSSTHGSADADESAYDLSGFESMVMRPRGVPGGPMITLNPGDYGDGVGNPSGVLFLAPLTEAVDMDAAEYGMALGITNGEWQRCQEQLQGLLDQAQSEGRSASWARDTWRTWVETDGPGFKPLTHLSVVLDVPEVIDGIRYSSRHKASGLTEVTTTPIPSASDIPRVVAVELRPGETIGEGTRRALADLLPDQADAIRTMPADELSEVISELGSGAHRTP